MRSEYPPLITIDEAARILSVTKKTLRRWEKRRLVNSVRTPGNQRRYNFADIFTLRSQIRTSQTLTLETKEKIIHSQNNPPYHYLRLNHRLLLPLLSAFAILSATTLASFHPYKPHRPENVSLDKSRLDQFESLSGEPKIEPLKKALAMRLRVDPPDLSKYQVNDQLPMITTAPLLQEPPQIVINEGAKLNTDNFPQLGQQTNLDIPHLE